MGYELWTSPITGYRRKGTRLSDLRSVLGAGILARTILEPLRCCPAEAPAHEMESDLKNRGFDVAGVKAIENGPVIGFVKREAMRSGSVKDHIIPISAEHLISDATSLSDLLNVFRTKERVFVLVGSEVKGIITRADLNKPPVRVYLFGLVSFLEMHLRFWVRNAYGEDTWKAKLKEPRIEAANKIQEMRRARNEEITLLDCLQFCDKRTLILANAELRTRLGLSSKERGEKLLKKAEDLRDLLAHGQHDLVSGSSWPALIENVEEVETLIHKSDDAIEEAAKSAHLSVDALWVAG
jgi:hypothetical protein